MQRTSGGAVVGVVGARGGAGASVVAASLARAAARRRETVTLVDLAPASGGVDVLLGIEDEPGVRWPDLTEARGRLDGHGLRERLPTWDGVGVVSATRSGHAGFPATAVVDVCAALANLGGLLVLDVGRDLLPGAAGPGPSAIPGPATSVGAHDSVVRGLVGACDEVLVVVPLDMTGVAGAVVLRDVLADIGPRAALVARRPAPGHLTPWEVGDAVGLELAATIAADSRVAGAVERGAGPCGARGPVRAVGGELAARYLGAP